MEIAKKQSLEEKKKNLFGRFNPTVNKTNIEKPPKKKTINNPFAQKFELLAQNAQKEEKIVEELQQRKLKKIKKAPELLKKSKQNLLRLSKENIRKSQSLFKKLSKQSLRRSCSREKNSRINSKASLLEEESVANTTIKKQMQNYLISQVLFDGKEDVKSSKLRIDKQAKCKDNKNWQEKERLQRENEIKKQVKEQLASIKKAENEQLIKNEEAKFEAYKKEMEKYLDFVCEKETKAPPKKNKSVIDAQPKKLKVNINAIKNQFEEGISEDSKLSPHIQSAPVKINKIDPCKFFPVELSNNDLSQKQTKIYIPVIIDKDAFQRTVGMFEKERREEEEKKQNEEKRKKRREEMESEKQRLIEEKKRIEDINKLADISRCVTNIPVDIKDNNEPIFNSEDRIQEVEASNEEVKLVPDCCEKTKENIDIHEKIRQELEKIRIEEEKQQAKIKKERKKQELMKQIQEEINKIKDTGVSKEKDDTPNWLQMVINPSIRKHNSVKEKKCFEQENERNEKEDFDIEPPKWIAIFQEKSKKIEEMKNNLQHFSKPAVLDSLKEQEPKTIIKIDKKMETTQPTATADNQIASSFNLASSHDNQISFLTERSVPEYDLSNTNSMESKIKKVKNMLLGQGNREQEEHKKQIKIQKNNASAIKIFFESKPALVKTEKSEKQPRKKIVHQPIIESNITGIKKGAQHWKWKQKDSKELYEFINSNKKYVPEELLTKAKLSLENKVSTLQTEEEILHEEAIYDEYLSKVENYIQQETENDTETIFKETLAAYLDLIDDRPKDKTKELLTNQKKKTISVSSTASLRDQFETSMNTIVNKPQNALVSKGI